MTHTSHFPSLLLFWATSLDRIVKEEQKIIEGNRGIGTSQSPFFHRKSASDDSMQKLKKGWKKKTAWKNMQKTAGLDLTKSVTDYRGC